MFDPFVSSSGNPPLPGPRPTRVPSPGPALRNNVMRGRLQTQAPSPAPAAPVSGGTFADFLRGASPFAGEDLTVGLSRSWQQMRQQ